MSKVPRRIKQNKKFLKKIIKCNCVDRTKLLKKANDKQWTCIYEILRNILAGNIKLSPKQLKKCGRYKQGLRTLIRKKVPKRNKRNILFKKQKGSGFFLPFLAALLPAILPLIVPRDE